MASTRQVALVTGAGRGLGRAFAQALAAQGLAVAVTSRTQSELDEVVASITLAGGEAVAVVGDVTDGHTVDHIVAEAERVLGPIDVLVNNAGVCRAVDLFYEADPDVWWRELEVNVRGPYLFARAVASEMRTRGHGRIINVASLGGIGAIAGVSAYCVSKAALIRLTEVMAIELRDAGVTVLAYHPGTVRTPMNEHLLSLPQTVHFIPWFTQMFEEGRDVPPDQSARTLVALASGAGDALSGCMINVDDDIAALTERRHGGGDDGLRLLRMKL
jgi:NAD(P)-dependent dehydrogenase (short-subunit alcohol dehydrogenase family)